MIGIETSVSGLSCAIEWWFPLWTEAPGLAAAHLSTSRHVPWFPCMFGWRRGGPFAPALADHSWSSLNWGLFLDVFSTLITLNVTFEDCFSKLLNPGQLYGDPRQHPQASCGWETCHGASAAPAGSSELTLSSKHPRPAPRLAIIFLKHFQERKNSIKKLGDIYKVVLNPHF